MDITEEVRKHFSKLVDELAADAMLRTSTSTSAAPASALTPTLGRLANQDCQIRK